MRLDMARGSPWREREKSSLILQFSLWLADRFRGLLTALGVEYGPFRELLRMRLALDMRPGKGMDKINLPILLALMWLAGLMPGVFALLVTDPFEWAFIEILITSGLLAVIMVLQLANLLMDGTDLHVVGPLPVKERTLFAARFAHACIYVCLLAVCLHMWPAFLAMFRVAWWAPVALAPTALVSTVFVAGSVALLYALLLRLFGPERFQRVTLWTQIGLSAMAMGGVHIVNQFVDYSGLFDYVQENPGALAALPFTWFAGMFALLAGAATTQNMMFTVAAILAPIVVAYVALRLSSRDLIAGLTAVQGGGDVKRPWRDSPSQRVGRRLCGSATELAGYNWALALSRREPAFLRTAYAQIAGMSMMAFSFAFITRSGNEVFPLHLLGYSLYILPMLIPTVLELGAYTEHPEAMRFLRALPADEPGRFKIGAIKALLFGTAFLPYAVLGPIVLLLSIGAGTHAAGGTLYAFTVALWLGFATTRRVSLTFPFSLKQRHGNVNTANFGVVMGLLVVIALCIGAHFALMRFLPAFAPVAAGLVAVAAFREYRALDASFARKARRYDETLLSEVA